MTNEKTVHATEVGLRDLAPLGVAAGLWLAALVLLCRAAAGELTRFPSPPVAGALSMVVFAIGVGGWTWDERRRRTADMASRAARGLAAAAAPLIISLTSAGGSAPVVGVSIALAFASGIWVVWSSCRGFDESALGTSATLSDRASSEAAGRLSAVDDGDAGFESELPNGERKDGHTEGSSLIDDPAVTQQIVRRAAESPGDSIEALLRVRFEAGVRETVIQLPIHPPLAGQPQVECEPLDCTDLTCTVTSARRFGVRIEIRRPSPCDQPLTALIGVEIHVRSAAEAAA